jgi:hypothetical protein
LFWSEGLDRKKKAVRVFTRAAFDRLELWSSIPAPGTKLFRGGNCLSYVPLGVLRHMRQQADYGGRQAFAAHRARVAQRRRIDRPHYVLGAV